MSLIGKEISDFQVKAFVEGEFRDISKADLLGKWSVMVFYPADFTFVPNRAERFSRPLRRVQRSTRLCRPPTATLSTAWYDAETIR